MEPRIPREPVKRRQSRRGQGKQGRVNFIADFETNVQVESCWVWAWGIVNIETPEYENVVVGTDINDFIEFLKTVNSNCYFHNLKFDGMFLFDWLLNNGYTHITDKDLYDNKTFKSLISDMGQFYSITVKWDNGNITEFRDSLKKLPMGVRRIAKAFNLEMGKGDIDYELHRPKGHKLTSEEEDYLRRDVSIVAQAMKQVLESGMTKLTVASDAMSEYKSLSGATKFNKMFPVFDYSMDAEIRRAYRGGFTYADDRFTGRVNGRGIVLDVNSLYPSVMKNALLPYGTPEFVRGEVLPSEFRPLTIFSVTFTASIKKDHIPCIQIKGSNLFIGTEYLKNIEEPTTMMVTNVDWELYNEHYDIEVLSYNGGWRFKGAVGMFDEYIEKWSEIKAKETGGKREIAKLHLNSLYGKFASNPNVTSKIPVLEDGVVKLKRGESETRDPVYTAVGIFITANARSLTINAAQANYKNFAYADTDSLHLFYDEEWDGVYTDPKTGKEYKVPGSIDIHPTKLGAWKFEYEFENAYYIRPKAYLERQFNGEYVNRIAGLPIDISEKLTFDDLVEGKVLHGKLTPKTVPGGVVLRDVPFKLKLS